MVLVLVAAGAVVAGALWWRRRSGADAAGASVFAPESYVTHEVPAASSNGAPVYVMGGVKLSELHPRINAWLEEWQRTGPFPVKVVSGGRNDAQQAAEYAKGRTAPGAVVTHAQTARESAHGYRRNAGARVACAIDVYPAVGPHEVVLDFTDARWPVLVSRVASFGGLKSGAHFSDFPHVEFEGWKSLPYADDEGR